MGLEICVVSRLNIGRKSEVGLANTPLSRGPLYSPFRMFFRYAFLDNIVRKARGGFGGNNAHYPSPLHPVLSRYIFPGST